jgi:hypothetical protein
VGSGFPGAGGPVGAATGDRSAATDTDALPVDPITEMASTGVGEDIPLPPQPPVEEPPPPDPDEPPATTVDPITAR